LVEFHKLRGRVATVTSVQPSGRFGALDLTDEDIVSGFNEKPKGDGSWINAGFFVMQPEIFRYLTDDETVLEKDPLESLAKEGELVAYKHGGFWAAMDSMRDKNVLEEFWKTGVPPWKVWA
ncbi:MAG TPA: sugar phosphate nucleotidyltransferase, partial [Bacilli bacterium]